MLAAAALPDSSSATTLHAAGIQSTQQRTMNKRRARFLPGGGTHLRRRSAAARGRRSRWLRCLRLACSTTSRWGALKIKAPPGRRHAFDSACPVLRATGRALPALQPAAELPRGGRFPRRARRPRRVPPARRTPAGRQGAGSSCCGALSARPRASWLACGPRARGPPGPRTPAAGAAAPAPLGADWRAGKLQLWFNNVLRAAPGVLARARARRRYRGHGTKHTPWLRGVSSSLGVPC